MKAAAIYARISNDPQGLRAGVERQQQDCRVHCEQRGWEVAGIYEDNDISAYSGKARPAYQRMLADVQAGKVQCIVAWHNDRLHRSPVELESFIDLVERTGVIVSTVTGGDYDLSNPDGRLSARIVGAVARKESEDKSRRLRRKHQDKAEKGEPVGRMGFGFDSSHQVVESEAALIREAAAKVLAGSSLRAIAADWNQRGVPTSYGKQWTREGVKRVLIAARIAGLREHQGQYTPATWPAIVDEDTWRMLVAVLTDPARNTNGPKARSYLLSGMLQCGLCGKRLVSRPRSDKTKQYICLSGPGTYGCGKLGVVAEPVERLVEKLVHDVIVGTPNPPKRGGAAPSSPELSQAQRVLDERLARLAEAHFVEGQIDKATYSRLRAKLEAEQEKLASGLVAEANKRRIVGSPDELREALASGSLEQRRSILSLYVEKVVIAPVKVRGRNKFDPSRITVHGTPALQGGMQLAPERTA